MHPDSARVAWNCVADGDEDTTRISFKDMEGLFLICGLVCAVAVAYAVLLRVRRSLRVGYKPPLAQDAPASALTPSRLSAHDSGVVGDNDIHGPQL